MKKGIRIISGLFFTSMILFVSLHSNPVFAKEGVADGYTDIVKAPNINIIDAVKGSSKEIDGSFGTMFKITENIQYEPFGLDVSKIWTDPNTFGDPTATKTKVFRFNQAYKPNEEKGMYVRNAAIHNGRVIDLKLVIDKMDFKARSDGTYPNLDVAAIAYKDLKNSAEGPFGNEVKYADTFLAMGSAFGNGNSNQKYQLGDQFDYHYEVYDHVTQEKVPNFQGTWNYSNVNGLKAVSTVKSDTDFSDFYIYDPGTVDLSVTNKDHLWHLGYKLDTPKVGQVEFTGNGIFSEDVNLDRGRLTQLYKGDIAMSMQKSDNGRPSNNGSSDGGYMAIMYNTKSIARIAPADPIVVGVTNDATHTDTANYERLKYSILQTIPDNDLRNRDTSFKLETEVPEQFQIDLNSVKIIQNGTDINESGSFDLTLDSTKTKLTVKAKDKAIGTDAFVGKVYNISLEAKKISQFDVKKDGYERETVDPKTGYMNYELGKSTKAYYEYLNPVVEIKKTLESKIIAGQSNAKVRHDAVPDAEGKTDLTADPETKISDKYTNPKDMLKNISLDTGEDISQVIVEQVNPELKTGIEDTITNVELKLTSRDGVAKIVTVQVKAVQPIATYTIKFVDEGNDKIHEPVELVKNKGSVVDLTGESSITDVITSLVTEGYDKELWSLSLPETAYPFDETKDEIVYKFKGTLKFVNVPETMSFGEGLVNPAIDQTLSYQGTEDFVLSVNDVRSNSVDGQPPKNDFPRGSFKILARVENNFKAEDGSKLTNSQIVYNSTGKDVDRKEFVENESVVIYKNEKNEKKSYDIKLDEANKTAGSKTGLSLELKQGNNAQVKKKSDPVNGYDGYRAKIKWDLVAGP